MSKTGSLLSVSILLTALGAAAFAADLPAAPATSAPASTTPADAPKPKKHVHHKKAPPKSDQATSDTK